MESAASLPTESLENSFNSAYVLIGNSNLLSKTFCKVSSLDFKLVYGNYDRDRKDDPRGAFIGYVSKGSIEFDQVFDPHTLELAISDIWELKARNPFELFIVLDLKNLLLF